MTVGKGKVGGVECQGMESSKHQDPNSREAPIPKHQMAVYDSWYLLTLRAPLSLDTRHTSRLICVAMNRSHLLRRQAFFWGLTLGIWALVVLAFTGQLMLARSLTWTQAAK